MALGAGLPLLAGVLESYAPAPIRRPRPHRADRLLASRGGRGQAGRRRDLARQRRQRRRLLRLLRQSRRQARARLQDRQRHLPQELGLRAVLDRCLRRARPAVQLARLPELSPQGRPRTSASHRRRARRQPLDAGAPLGPADDRRGEGEAREPPRELDSRADLWRAAAGPLDPRLQGRRRASRSTTRNSRSSSPAARSSICACRATASSILAMARWRRAP